jgi:hypothetical protein
VALAAVLFAYNQAQPADPGANALAVASVPCATPFERAANEGWTTDVSCRCDAGDGARVRGPARLLFGLPLDVNRADARALEVLPRIGPRRAAAIVEARTKAPFDSLSDLERIVGIGPATVAGLVGLADAGTTRNESSP